MDSRTFCCLLISLLLSQIAEANHAHGGELSYTWVSGNTYRMHYTIYRDCAGIAAPVSVLIEYFSPSVYPTPVSATLQPIIYPTDTIANICPLETSTCDGGTAFGLEVWEYFGTITLPGPAPDWLFMHNECCRSTLVTNLVSPGNSNMFSLASLNNADVAYNNSVSFTSRPLMPVLAVGQEYNLDFSAQDSDGDSLVYTLVDAYTDLNTPITYQSGFSSTNPITSAVFHFDSTTGILTVEPTLQEWDVVVVEVSEYRSGQLIARSWRDFSFIIQADTNPLPGSNGIGNQQIFDISICAGDSLGFYFSTYDPNLIQSVDIQGFSGDATGISSNTIFNAHRDSALVVLTPDTNMFRPEPYELLVSLSDNNCPYTGLQTIQFNITVEPCVTSAPSIEAMAKLEVFPNPATTKCRWTSDLEVQDILLTDASGRTIRPEFVTTPFNEISVGKLPDGIYTARFQFKSGFLTRRICIAR